MKFIILSILGVFAFRTSGVSADCCQTSGECPEGYKSIGSFDNNIFTVGLTIIGSNKVCVVDSTTSSCTVDSSLAFCSGGDVLTSTLSTPAPSTTTPPTQAPPTPASPASTCCKTSGECPEGYKSIGSIDNNILCGVKIDGGTSSCTIDSSMKTCPGDDTPSSAGKIGMGYVWFVAAAAAFAGIN